MSVTTPTEILKPQNWLHIYVACEVKNQAKRMLKRFGHIEDINAAEHWSFGDCFEVDLYLDRDGMEKLADAIDGFEWAIEIDEHEDDFHSIDLIEQANSKLAV